MLFGGLSVRGLIPPTAPIFMDEIKAQWVASGKSLGKRGNNNKSTKAKFVGDKILFKVVSRPRCTNG